jgi:hypothetical protein
MAIVKNFWLQGASKKLAGSVIYQAMGQTRQRELATEVHNPRTPAQMSQRVKFANLVNLYRANASWMKFAFETKKTAQSDYNKFMSLNLTSSNIYLTKQEAAAGGCVVQEYQITQGSLPSIETTYDFANEWWNTNIFTDGLGHLNEITVADFSTNLIDNNPGIREGDQLSFIRMTQMTNSFNGAPYVIVRKYELKLSRTNQAFLSDYLPTDYIDTNGGAEIQNLVVKDSGQAGGFVLILSRTQSGKTFVSSQNIVVANNSATINAHSSRAALDAAIASYGESDEPFLTSTSAAQYGQDFVPLSILNVTTRGRSIAPGEVFLISDNDADKQFDIVFNGELTGEDQGVMLLYMANGQVGSINLLNSQISGNKVSGTMPAAAQVPDDAAVFKISVGVDAESYEAVFGVPNEYTIQGLE